MNEKQPEFMRLEFPDARPPYIADVPVEWNFGELIRRHLKLAYGYTAFGQTEGVCEFVRKAREGTVTHAFKFYLTRAKTFGPVVNVRLSRLEADRHA